jgi:putative Mn2+ efflux pump MntP
MRIDLNTRLSLGFAFGWVGLAVLLVGGLLGQEVPIGLASTFGGIVIATLGVGAMVGSKRDRDDSG